MIGIYNYTVILTYVGVVSALVGIGFAAGGDAPAAVVCLMVSGFCDLFDGTIARTMQRDRLEKKFGIQIDSLADLICFGVLPVCIGRAIGLDRFFEMLPMTLYVLAALIRLAYYNVTEDELQNENAKRTHYDGLPVTTVALLIPMLYVFRPYTGGAFRYLYLSWMLVIACLFLTRIKVRKLGMFGMCMAVVIGLGVLALLIVGWNYEIIF